MNPFIVLAACSCFCNGGLNLQHCDNTWDTPQYCDAFACSTPAETPPQYPYSNYYQIQPIPPVDRVCTQVQVSIDDRWEWVTVCTD